MSDGIPAAVGGCLCGAVRFAISGPVRRVVTCHCALCRRAGTSVGAYAACAAGDLGVEGAPRWYRSSAAAERGFCETCGAQLFWRRIGAETVSVSAGAFDDPSALAWGEHILVDGRDTRP